MMHFDAVADRVAELSLKLVLLANALFFASFLAALLIATNNAQAAETVCSGKDMFAALEREDPALAQQIRDEAAATENGHGLLWKVEKDGETSFLFGTMHMTDPRVTALTPAAREAFETSGTVVIETTDILDQSKMMASLMQHPELMMFTDGTTLTSLMSAEDAKAVEAGLEARGIPLASVLKMKPWMLSAMVTLPACELARKSAGTPVLDAKLAAEAEAAGKRLEGLETAQSQLEAMASLPMDFHIAGLTETLKLGKRIDDIVETMIALYLRGDTAMFWPFFRAVLPEDGDQAGFAAFEETMISSRNAKMAESAAPILAEGDAFIAVGALHLPGENGLIELLRKAGHTVTLVQ